MMHFKKAQCLAPFSMNSGFVPLLALFGILSGCASRDFEAGSVEQSQDSSAVETSEVRDEGKLEADYLITGFSGALIHEADNKHPLFLKKKIESLIRSEAKRVPLEVNEEGPERLPRLLRPADGYNSAIGEESYLSKRRQETLSVSDINAQGLQKDPLKKDELTKLKRLWLLLASYGSGLGYFQTARHLKDYMLVRQSEGQGKRPVSELSMQAVHGALDQLGFWSRQNAEGAAKFSAGERILQRNRALILLEFMSKIQGRDQAKFDKLKSMLLSLQDSQSDSRLLWVRTHSIVSPSEDSDWNTALGQFSVLSYTFAHVSEVQQRSFVLTTLTYNFMFGVHSWSGIQTEQILKNWCGEKVRKEPLFESTCDELNALHLKLGRPSLGVFADAGLASEFEARGYSPVYLKQEKFDFSALSPELFNSLQEEISKFSL